MPSTTLPQELRDQIQALAIQDEIVQVHTICTPGYREEVELNADDMAEMTEEEIQEFFAEQGPTPEYTLTEVRLIFSPNLNALLAAEETRDQIMALIYQNCTLDFSEMTLYGKPEYRPMLHERLHRFRKVRIGLGIVSTPLIAGLFDEVDHLTFLAGGYSWPMLEDTSATTWARAKKSMFKLSRGAVVDIMETPMRNPPFRLMEDPERDAKAVAWAKSVNGI